MHRSSDNGGDGCGDKLGRFTQGPSSRIPTNQIFQGRTNSISNTTNTYSMNFYRGYIQLNANAAQLVTGQSKTDHIAYDALSA